MRVVHPVDRSGPGLHPRLLTVAELLQTCGEEVPQDISRSSAADIEIFLDERCASHDLRRYKGTLETDAEDRWTCTLQEEDNAEDDSMAETLVGTHTKMVLARCLERLTGEDRRKCWSSNLQDLQARAQALVDFQVVPAAPPGPRGRGGGRARGAKGKGKGRRGR